MFSQRNLQAEENLYTKTVVRVIPSGTAVTALPNTAKRFSRMPGMFSSWEVQILYPT